MDADRSRNVLDRLLAHILESKAELVANLIVNVARDANSPRLGKRFEPGGHVDAIAVDIVLVADDVPDIDADAKLNAALNRHIGVAFEHAALNVDGTSYCVDHTDKFHKHSIAGRLHDPAAMLGDLGVDQSLSMRLELAKRALLISAHQSAV